MKLDIIRHSLAHILAAAVQELYPGTKFAIGPAIENGFYYDFEFPQSLTPEDLPKIEKKMKESIKQNISFEKKVISKTEAKKLFKNQPYKLELIDELSFISPLRSARVIDELPGKKVSIYQSGDFVDLCKGPHVRSSKEIPSDAFKLTRIAGAYWRGQERNPMLTRIYGIAFSTKKELENHLFIEIEAGKRDHRVIGQKLDLFHIDAEVGPGLILWHPKGALLKKIIMDYALNEYLKAGYQLVDTPHLAKLNLWRISGHTDFYKENMFPPIRMSEISREEKDDYQIKPMNCPFHIAIYKTDVRSYKNLPLRYTEMGTVYRYEKSGTLHGLVRVRGFTQDDAHIICTPEQLAQELFSTLKLTLKILKAFGFKDFDIYLSTRPSKSIGTPKIWKKAENSLQYALKKMKLKYQIDAGGGAFYGPKIDIKVKDSLGRPWQCTTIQVDFNLAECFNITYIDQKGRKQRPILIHRALLGSLERFIGILLEYYGGALPFWLSPEQIWIIPIGSRHENYAKTVAKEFIKNNLRIKVKDENETVSKKIRNGEIQKIPYLLVVGDKERQNKTVRVRERGKGDIGMMKLAKFLDKIK